MARPHGLAVAGTWRVGLVICSTSTKYNEQQCWLAYSIIAKMGNLVQIDRGWETACLSDVKAQIGASTEPTQ